MIDVKITNTTLNITVNNVYIDIAVVKRNVLSEIICINNYKGQL